MLDAVEGPEFVCPCLGNRPDFGEAVENTRGRSARFVGQDSVDQFGRLRAQRR